jgi:predicted aldo/keto reductase-like oxidoreductase
MASMIYRRFGRTELQMPVFSCGGMRYQHSWTDTPLDQVPAENQRNLEATIHRSVELGVNHIETARGYGSSERQLGLVLPKFPRDRIIVQTKIFPTEDPAEFVRHFHESLQRLRLDRVDLLALHGVNTYRQLQWSVRPGGCLEAARGLQRQGLAGHIGFSTHASLPVILAAIQTDAHGGFDYVNLHWYYIYQSNWPAVLEAQRRDMGLFIISPSDKGGMLYQPPKKLVDLCRPLHPLVFNCLFCLSRPEVHTLSLGAARPGDFDLQMESLRYLEEADALLPPIEKRLRQAMVDAVGADVVDRFTEGIAEWDRCPGYMNVKVMLWLRNLARAYDLVEYGKMRYNLLGNGGDWFPGLGAANIDSLPLDGAFKDSPFADRVPQMLREAHELLGGQTKRRLSQS